MSVPPLSIGTLLVEAASASAATTEVVTRATRVVFGEARAATSQVLGRHLLVLLKSYRSTSSMYSVTGPE
jgi:hypothetical protein